MISALDWRTHQSPPTAQAEQEQRTIHARFIGKILSIFSLNFLVYKN